MQLRQSLLPSLPPRMARGKSWVSFIDVEMEVAFSLTSTSYFYAGYDPDDVAGVFVSTYLVLEIGTIVGVTVHLPSGESFRSISAVEWTRDQGLEDEGVFPGMGLALEPLAAEQRAIVSPWSRRRAPLFYVED